MKRISFGMRVWEDAPLVFAVMFGCWAGLMATGDLGWHCAALAIPAFLCIASLTSRWIYEDWRDAKAARRKGRKRQRR